MRALSNFSAPVETNPMQWPTQRSRLRRNPGRTLGRTLGALAGAVLSLCLVSDGQAADARTRTGSSAAIRVRSEVSVTSRPSASVVK